MWDPKRLDKRDEPVPPQTPIPGTVPAPAMGVLIPASESGICGRCHKPFGLGDRVAMAATGPQTVRWHEQCWIETYPESPLR